MSTRSEVVTLSNLLYAHVRPKQHGHGSFGESPKIDMSPTLTPSYQQATTNLVSQVPGLEEYSQHDSAIMRRQSDESTTASLRFVAFHRLDSGTNARAARQVKTAIERLLIESDFRSFDMYP